MDMINLIDSPLVTVITPTTGNSMLLDALHSVKNQTYKNIEHFVVVDGPERKKEALKLTRNFDVKLLVLPHATGKDNYNGHRIYGASTYLVNGLYTAFLDEDNYYDPTHIESCVRKAQEGFEWVYSLRKIIDKDKKFICNDDCESLGKWKSVLNDNFIDVGCWFLSKPIALMVSPLWYRRARHPEEQPEVDRIITHTLMQHAPKFECTNEYSLNYRVGSRADSVQAEFFINGNQKMKEAYKDNLPWKKKEEYITIEL
jgi:glycosyltransferase involved in cell wall biosynthesis